jgi:hypothetical protein
MFKREVVQLRDRMTMVMEIMKSVEMQGNTLVV